MRTIDSSLFTPYEKLLLPAEPLSKYAFSLCGGPCAGAFRVEGSQMLMDLIGCCTKAGCPYKVLGGMTNILISDDGFDGVALLNRRGKISHATGADGTVILTAESGAGMAAVVRYCIDHEISGMEWAAGLPGTVGGAVCGNAGAFGTETAAIYLSGRVSDRSGMIHEYGPEDMGFAYRRSNLKGQDRGDVLLEASFRLKTGQKELIISEGEAYRERRRNTQPVDENSLGSVFKNPPGGSAGKLIQDAGLKGYSIGGAAVSRKHANFITTTKGVTAADYRSLTVYVQQEVLAKFGILLEPEIELFGFGVK